MRVFMEQNCIASADFVRDITLSHDVIAAVFGLAALASFTLFFGGPAIAQLFALFMLPAMLVISLGIFVRSDAIRVLLLVLLGVGIVFDGLLIAYYLGVLADFFDAPSNKDPSEELLRMPFRIGLAIAMFGYLRRTDVRAEFIAAGSESEDTPPGSQEVDG